MVQWWSPPASAEDEGLIAGPRRSHTPQGNWAQLPQLPSPCALELALHNKRSQRDEKPPLPTERKPMCSNKDPEQPETNKVKKKFRDLSLCDVETYVLFTGFMELSKAAVVIDFIA